MAVSALEKPAVDTDIQALDIPDPELHCDGRIENKQGMDDPCPRPVTHRAVLSCGHHFLICHMHYLWCRDIVANEAKARCAACPGDPFVTMKVLEPIHP